MRGDVCPPALGVLAAKTFICLLECKVGESIYQPANGGNWTLTK